MRMVRGQCFLSCIASVVSWHSDSRAYIGTHSPDILMMGWEEWIQCNIRDGIASCVMCIGGKQAIKLNIIQDEAVLLLFYL